MIKRLSLVILLLLLVTANGTGGVAEAQDEAFPPLTEPGPFGVRLTTMTFVDENRVDWEIETSIYYPADKTQGTPFMRGSLILRDAPPDRSGAPYPLLLYSHSWSQGPAELFDVMAHLASYGYVVAAVQHHDAQQWRYDLVDRPLDILTVLDDLTTITDGDLAGMMDTSHVGLMGYLMGGTTALQMLGLERDPAYFAAWCDDHPDLKTWDCNPPPSDGGWPFEEIAAYRDLLGLENLPDGSWAPFGDIRIRAVLVLEPLGFPLTSEDMLNEVTTPTMVVHGTHDVYGDYEGNAVRTYTHLGTEDRYLITLVNGDGQVFYAAQDVPQHFATAFFGKYLQGDETYTPYLSAEHLPDWSFPRLVWGPYEAE